MKKHILCMMLFIIAVRMPFAAAKRSPESCRDSTPPLKDCYAPYFAIGAASFVDGEEDDRIKELEKKEKAAEKARKKAEKKQKKGKAAAAPKTTASPENDPYFIRTVRKHFTELSSGTKLLPATLLGKKPGKLVRYTASDGCSYEVPEKWDSQYLALFLDEAQTAGVQVRFHLLVCPEMSPGWFFFRNYDTASRLAGKAEMTARLEWYIKKVTDFISNWEYEHNLDTPLVTSYDVVSELFTDTGDLNRTPFNYLMQIYGDTSYAVQAFAIAARCVPASVKLCYCDHSLFEKKKAEKVKDFIGAVRAADKKCRVDEIGIISHLEADWPDRNAFFAACRDFSSLGLGVHIQQLDISARSEKDSSSAYYDFMKACRENTAVIQGVSFRAVTAVDQTEFVDYMRAPLFLSDYSCTGNFDRVIEASGREE